MGESKNSTLALDLHLLWKHIFSLVYVGGYYAYLYLVFLSGHVDLSNSTIAAIVNSSIIGLSAALMVIVRDYFREGFRHEHKKDNDGN